VHKKAGNVEFEDVAICFVIVGTTLNKIINLLYAKMCSFSAAAGIAVVEKFPLEQVGLV
jgi:hypothetical protein